MNPSWIAEHAPFKAPPQLPLAITHLNPPVPNGAPMDDWNVLLRAVKERLQHSVDERVADARSQVLDCVGALDQLQAILQHEAGRLERLEHELLETQTALARTRAELHGSQAGERLARHLARHDPLTTLPNRSCFRERLDRDLSLEGSQR